MRRSLITAPLAAALITLASPIHAESVVVLTGCEYRVTLPAKPTIKQSRQVLEEQTKRAWYVAELRHQIPAFKIECAEIDKPSPNPEREPILAAAHLAEQLQLTNVDVASEHTRLGFIAHFTGDDEQAGIPFVVTGTVYYGNTSAMYIIATEAAQTYPSPIVRRVFRSVER